MNRYSDAVAALAAELRDAPPGIGFVQTPPGEQQAIAEALREAGFADAVIAPLSPERAADTTPYAFATGLPDLKKAGEDALSAINARRNWTANQGRRVLLLLDRWELELARRFAADSWSARTLMHVVAFVPRDDVDEVAARTALAAWNSQQLGTLDLRGFIRSEGEDAAYEITALYQDLSAQERSTRDRVDLARFETSFAVRRGSALLDKLLTDDGSDPRSPVVLLGGPGSGKSFYLRRVSVRGAAAESFFGIEKPWPLMVSMTTLYREPGPVTLVDYFQELLLREVPDAGHAFHRVAAEGRAIFMVDGLDEVDGGVRLMTRFVEKAREQAPKCLVIATSRLAGYESAIAGARELDLAPFDDAALEAFLVKWSELYAVHRGGEVQRATGKKDGEALYAEVDAKSEVKELARTPLLATIIGIVRRAGMHLPDHRVELYSQASTILIERWNDARSLDPTRPAAPLRKSDAVRLLGPVAVRIIESETRSGIPEAALRRLLSDTLAKLQDPKLPTADEAIRLFKNTLGLLVEHTPGAYSFLHLTLAEYFAAWELVRSEKLEELVSDPKRAFAERWKEVICLAVGELGLIRVDDLRLERIVAALVHAATRVGHTPQASALLLELLADDAQLPRASASALIEWLVPASLPMGVFKKSNGPYVALLTGSSVRRALTGRLGPAWRERIDATCSPTALGALLAEAPGSDVSSFLEHVLPPLGIQPGEVILAAAALVPGRPFLLVRSLWSGQRMVLPVDGFICDAWSRGACVLQVRSASNADVFPATSVAPSHGPDEQRRLVEFEVPNAQGLWLLEVLVP